MLRSLAYLVAVAMATLLSACCPEEEFIPTAIVRDTLQNPAFLRIIHAAADAPPARAVLDSRQGDFILALGYLNFQSGFNEGKYYRADTATNLISFVSGTVLASKQIKMKAGQYYTAYLHGRAPNYDILITTDTVKPKPPGGQLRIHVVNLAPDSPPIDIHLSTSPTLPLTSGLAYGQATPYSTRYAVDLQSPGLTVTESASGDTLIEFLPGLLPLPEGVIMTLLISGETRPSGNAPMLSFTAFFESTFDPTTGLYGSFPLRVNLAAMRLVNLVPMESWQGVDLSFYDAQFEQQFPGFNDGYRRNYPGQIEVWNVGTLTQDGIGLKGYFLQSYSDLKPDWKYRVEWRTREYRDPSTQRPISNPDTIHTELNQRYTIVVFGDTATRVRTTELHDNTALPAPGRARLRFFHGGVGTLESNQLKLRAMSDESPLQAYGFPAPATSAFDAPAGGSVALEVVDQAGNVVLSSQHDLISGKIYSVFLTPKADKSGYVLRPVSDDLRR